MFVTALARRNVPAPGEAPMPAPNAAALLRRNAADPSIRDRVAVRFGDRTWTHAEYVGESCCWANLFAQHRPVDRALHVGVLLDNTPDYLFALGGAALSGSAIVGLNHTRRGEHLLRDVVHTHVGLVVSEPRHLALLEPIVEALPGGRDGLLVSHRFPEPDDPVVAFGASLDDALATVSDADEGLEPDPSAIWGLIFTSGTSDAPKAVICSQRRLMVTGTRMGIIMDLRPDDVGYVCMPLFHSSALMVGWAPSIVNGASIGLGRKFSASRWLADVRRYGATYFNYTGKPLAYLLSTPEQPDDADNTLRVAFGNEGSPEIVEQFSRRFGVEVIDAYGATEIGRAHV
jgi:fatty-acyl-CoA synthase